MAPTQMKSEPKPPFQAEKQQQPGLEAELEPKPRFKASKYKPAGKLKDKVALVTGGDSGIGRAVASLFAREGADVAINFLPEERRDADETKAAIEREGRRCLMIEGDLTSADFCRECVERVVTEFGQLDILVSNAAHQTSQDDIEDISDEEWDRTFKTNVYAFFWLVKAALPHLDAGASIIVTGSETGFLGPGHLPDYSATKGAIHTMTKSFAKQLAQRGIRVNCVAPGPVWTPLNPADADAEKVSRFGADVPMKRPAQPEEISPAFVFLASPQCSSYITGEILPIIGGYSGG